MLMLTVDVLERFPEALERWQQAFRYILVDEYQDTNHAQYRLLQLLADEHRNVFAVGDPDQSVYGFRGADIRNILDFERDFPGARDDRARAELPLDELDPRRGERRHREQPRAQAEAPLLRARRRATRSQVIEVEDEHAEARFVAAEIARLVGERPLGERDRRLLPDERAVARARGRARPPGRPLPGDRRPALLRARRDQGRRRLSRPCSQLHRRGLAAPDREPAAARDRRHVAAAARHPRRLARRSRSGRRWPTPRRPVSAPPR